MNESLIADAKAAHAEAEATIGSGDADQRACCEARKWADRLSRYASTASTAEAREMRDLARAIYMTLAR